MPALRSVVAVLGLVLLAGSLAATGGAAAPAKSRAEFEALLKERAVPVSLQTDFAGAWAQAYQFVLMARALDRGLYERALLTLDTDSCDAGKPEPVRLSCAMNRVAAVASSLTLFAPAVEFRKDAVAQAERVADRDPGPLLDVLIDLAFDEAVHGSLSEAERAVERAGALLAAHPHLVGPRRRFDLAIIRAKLADARLDDANAAAALAEAVEVALRSGVKAGNFSDPGYVRTELLDDLARLHLRGRFCAACGGTAAEPVRRWIAAVLTGRADDPKSPQPHADHMLMALSAPAGTFTGPELDAFAKRFVALVVGRGKIHPDIQRLIPRDAKIQDLARDFALASLIADGASLRVSESYMARPVAAVRPQPDGRPGQDQALRASLEDLVSGSFEQFGAESAVAGQLDTIARQFQSFGLRRQARVTLQYLMARGAQSENAETLRREREKLAAVYAPALARLASLDFAAGERASALRNLDQASALAAAKLRAEWKAGGAGAILALRDLAPTLRLVAQKRAEIVAPGGLSRDGADHDTLFRELQAAMFGETALAVEVANQRRILADEATRDLHRRYLSALAEAERAAEIAGYTLESGDVDGARAAAQRAAEGRRDALARDFRARVPQALTAAADIDPVPLAEARARLRAGEALVLLHVGSHGLHGFLLDADGRSLAWRSPVRREALEGLVRSLRAGGDATHGIQPFPAADAARLHALIFGPAQDRLGAYDKLILVGDGPLQAMPYGLLLTRPAEVPATPDGYRAASLPWLIRSHALALLPSVRTLVAQRSDALASRAAKPFLGIGDPSFGQPETRVADASGALRGIDVSGAFQTRTGLADVGVLRRLVGLPETADELRAIAALLGAPPGSLMLGAGATERAVRAAPLSDYRIVAFATHGALAGEVTGTSEPGLVLTPPAAASREDDGFLALSEITGLRFDADLVMLSACNTAASDGRPRAEGLSGLARGFFNAGARSLLATHWAIPSISSVKVTTGLIAHRAERPQADWAEALRAATLAVIDREGPGEWAHPAYWGGFAVIGVLPARP